MVAPAVESEIVTICAVVYVPGSGVKAGVATWPNVITYVADPGALFKYPDATAIAAIVSEVETVIGPEYNDELVVGVEPSVV